MKIIMIMMKNNLKLKFDCRDYLYDRDLRQLLISKDMVHTVVINLDEVIYMEFIEPEAK